MVKVTKNKKHFESILDNLRQQDLEEVQALWKENWKDEVLKSINGQKTLVLFEKNIPIAMGGFVPIKDKNLRIAVVWLLCSCSVYSNKSLFYKVLKDEIKKAENKYDVMFNYIYKSNFEAKNWLKRLGFQFDNPRPLSLNIIEDFEFFYKVKEGVII